MPYCAEKYFDYAKWERTDRDAAMKEVADGKKSRASAKQKASSRDGTCDVLFGLFCHQGSQFVHFFIDEGPSVATSSRHLFFCLFIVDDVLRHRWG